MKSLKSLGVSLILGSLLACAPEGERSTLPSSNGGVGTATGDPQIEYLRFVSEESSCRVESSVKEFILATPELLFTQSWDGTQIRCRLQGETLSLSRGALSEAAIEGCSGRLRAGFDRVEIEYFTALIETCGGNESTYENRLVLESPELEFGGLVLTIDISRWFKQKRLSPAGLGSEGFQF